VLEKLKFKSSAELFDAGYAVQQYDISTVMRTWRYKDKTFTTPYDVPVETVMWNELPMQVLPMTKMENRRARKTN
jgi:hypothetical protein